MNEVHENLEAIIDDICYFYKIKKPRMYREIVRKDYLNLAKCKKRTKKKSRLAIKQQLQYIRRNLLSYIDMFVLAKGVELPSRQAERLTVFCSGYYREYSKYTFDALR